MPTSQPTAPDTSTDGPSDEPTAVLAVDDSAELADDAVTETAAVDDTEVALADEAVEGADEDESTEVLAHDDLVTDGGGEPDDPDADVGVADRATSAASPRRLAVAIPLVLLLVVGLVVIGVASSGSDSGGGAAVSDTPGASGDAGAPAAAGEGGTGAPGAAAGDPAAAGQTDAGGGAAPAEPPPISVDESVPGEASGGPSVIALDAPTPARPGRYQLRVSVNDEESAGSYVVEGSGTTQTHRVELGDSSSTQQLTWGDGVSVAATTSGTLGSCSWSPPARLFPGTADVGTSWTSSSDCTVQMTGAEVAVHQETQARVDNRGTTQVGDQLVEVWVISRRETQSRQTGGITVTSEVATSELYAPQLGIVVERQSRATAPRPDGSTQSMVIVERIESLVS